MNYKDANLSIDERLNDLMRRLSFKQKIDQITCLVTIGEDTPDFKGIIPQGIGHVGAFAVAENMDIIADYTYALQDYLLKETEFGIPALVHCEAISGGQFTGADVFPSAIGQASTWNPDLVKKMADIIREQMLAMGFRHALSPVFDISRDPRWGRLTETYGEDPTLASAIGTAFVKGLQTDNLKEGVAATGKHFIGHGVTEGALNMSGSLITPRNLEEVHAKPFQAAITLANLSSVMNSYCSYDNEPVVCSKRLLTELLRDDMGFKGIVVSDYISADRILDPFCVAETYQEAGVKAISAGLDVEYPRPKCFTYKLEEEVKEGRLDIKVIDSAVRRVLRLKFELGLFENPYPDRVMVKKVFSEKGAQDLNKDMSRESITLLKNENKTLPLSKDVRKIAVIGPHADTLRSFFGTFSYPAVLDMTSAREEDGHVFKEKGLIVYDIHQRFPGDLRESTRQLECKLKVHFPTSKTVFEAIRDYLPDAETKSALGINYLGHNSGNMDEALNIAAWADVVILTLGGKNGWGITSTVGEGVDSTSIDLPGYQEEFARKVYSLNKKTVVLHFDGRPLSNMFVNTHFDAILEVWQPGEYAACAIAEILFGDYNPSGRLPITVARNAGQLPVYYGLSRGSGYTGAGHTGMVVNKFGYINDTAFPAYSFGHGLSYTKFEYEKLKLLTKCNY